MGPDEVLPVEIEVTALRAEQAQAVANVRQLLVGAERKRSNALSKLLWLALSVVAFVALTRPGGPVTVVLAVVPVVFLHELGHFVAMRLLGYRDLSILFIPWFGAATSGREVAPSQAKRALVALSGPVPGIILGFVVLCAVDWQAHEALAFGAIFLFFLNLLNLLPILPLDGGRVVEAAVASRWAVTGIGLALVSPLALLVLGAWWSDYVVIGFGAFLLMGVLPRIGAIRIASELRRAGYAFASDDIQALSDDQLWAILSEVRARFRAAKDGVAAALVRDVHRRMTVSRMPPALAIGLLALYVLAIGGGVLGGLLTLETVRHGEFRLQGRPLSKWVERLHDPDETTRTHALTVLTAALRGGGSLRVALLTAAGLEELGERSKPALPALVEGLQHPNGAVRLWSAKALCNLGPAAAPAVGELAGALKDPDAGVRGWAAAAIAGMGQPAEVAKVELLGALHDGDEWVRAWAAAALSHLRPPDPQVLKAMEHALRVETSGENRKALEAIMAELKELLEEAAAGGAKAGDDEGD